MCEILQELAVALWRRSPVIPATLTLGPGTGAAQRTSDSREMVLLKLHVQHLSSRERAPLVNTEKVLVSNEDEMTT